MIDRKRGRPPVAPADKQSKCVKVYLTDAELAALDEDRGTMPRSTYIRFLMLAA